MLCFGLLHLIFNFSQLVFAEAVMTLLLAQEGSGSPLFTYDSLRNRVQMRPNEELDLDWSLCSYNWASCLI